jgi:hypothetical protein
MKRWMNAAMNAAWFSLLVSTAAHADVLTGTRTITLGNAQGERIVIGQITFTPEADGKSRFKIVLDEKLGEYFLAMRPFRCLTGPKQRLCNFPVENEAPLVSPADLTPLEYALMFMHTLPAALHVNPFNGAYYRMKIDGERIVGRQHDVDMDPFIAPTTVPLERRKRPLRDEDLTVADERSHWLPQLTIE